MITILNWIFGLCWAGLVIALCMDEVDSVEERVVTGIGGTIALVVIWFLVVLPGMLDEK